MSHPGDAPSQPSAGPQRPARSGGSTRTASSIFSWVPIRSLAKRHRHRILSHLLELEPSDRYLRFGHPATDEQIRKYVMSLDFQRDEVFGIFNRRLQLIAVAHLAYEAPQFAGTSPPWRNSACRSRRRHGAAAMAPDCSTGP